MAANGSSTMSTTAPVEQSEIAALRHQVRITDIVLRLTLDGLTQEDTLIQPRPAGNCLNWVVGHLVTIYHSVFPLLGQEPVLPPAVLKRYDRGGPGLSSGAGALDISELRTAWDETSRRIDAGLAALDPATLGNPAPFSPGGSPDETVATLLATIVWHQGYHVGQAGLLRRMAGKPGVIG
jgi:uncharacterized damage-inducible protein DinB